MKLTTKGRYAVQIMLEMVRKGDERSLSAAALAENQSISESYSEQILLRLRRCGLIQSARGARGGYRLARAAEDISIASVFAAVEERTDATRCGGLQDCHTDRPCIAHDLWAALTDHIDSFLASVTLAGAARHRQLVPPVKQLLPKNEIMPSLTL
jgi:Rrf2 family iron-sulfur cluster assembly transcriptional regulator